MNRQDKAKQITKEHFNQQAKTYEQGYDGKFVKAMYSEIIERAGNIKADCILDLGCGTGNILAQLVQRTTANLYGLDLCENMIEVAKERLNENVILTVGDAEKLPYKDQQFDLIICNASFHHYTKPEKVLKEIKRVLKPQGTLILGDPTGPKLYLKFLNFFLKWSNSGDYKIYEREGVTTLLNQMGFEVTDWKKIEHRIFILNARSI